LAFIVANFAVSSAIYLAAKLAHLVPLLRALYEDYLWNKARILAIFS
jgi:hypothetical protein